MSSALLTSLLAKAEKLEELEPAVRADEPDAVHQMRVAARTLRANLRTFADVLPDSGDLVGELAWLGDALGPAREAEVMAEVVLGLLARTPEDLVVGPVRERVEQVFGLDHESALTVVAETLDSERYHELVRALKAYAESAKPGRKPDLSKLHRKVRRRMRAALPMPHGPERDVAMHDARKATRRARYAAEALGHPSKPIKALADVLGEEHDRVVTATALTDLAAGANQAGENAFTYGVLLGLVRCDSRKFDKQVRKAWRKARKEL
ncbi:CHAD domain-containing protein [Catenulispora subtropica]|uniref:CHAD domain-containing protein n=1 Tax=Catenulispora subtropica TaxID=450798 RepID=A0ABN2RRS0_9ACTN